MKIVIVTPAATGTRNGNRNTAQRWAMFLRQLGHIVKIQVEWDGWAADLMLALHARRSHHSIRGFATAYTDRPLIVVLTGTDIYRDIHSDADAQKSLYLATLLVLLQGKGIDELPPEMRAKAHVIFQSATPISPRPPLQKRFEICIIGNLREEKDPFRTALATGHLPEASRIAAVHMGRALDKNMADEALALMKTHPRYRWLGELPHWKVVRRLARCRLMVISSRMEGGANVVCEALAAGVPIIASRVSGNIGMLGEEYVGFYPCGDELALAKVLQQAENDPLFYETLCEQCAERQRLIRPEREKSALVRLVMEAFNFCSNAPEPVQRSCKAV